MKCKFCEREMPKKSQHQTYCKSNPERKIRKNPMQGKKGKNQFTKAKEKGETCKFSKDTILKLSLSMKGKKLSEEHKQKLSLHAKRNGLGGVTQSRWIKYGNKTLGSSFELKVAEDLDKFGIRWDTCKKFNYIDPNGKVRSYTPDIYLIDFDIYLDPKNDFLIENVNPKLGFTDEEKIKRVQMQNDIRVLILNKDELSWEKIKEKI